MSGRNLWVTGGRGVPMDPVRGLVLLLLLAVTGCSAAGQSFDPVIMDPPQSADRAPASMSSVRIPSHGERLNGIVYLPGGRGPHPVVVLLHGLPGDERNLDLAQGMRRAGWAVVFFHYRGAWGSPGSFSFTHVLEDTAAAVDWTLLPAVRRQFGFDGAPRTLVGHSMGGFAALAAGSDHAGVQCIASLAGANLGLMGALADDDAVRAATAAAVQGWIEGPLAGTSGAALIDEAVASADRFDTRGMGDALAARPLLMVAATRDTDVPMAQHHTPLLVSIRAAGGDVTEQVLPTDHAFSDTRIALTHTLVDWLGTHCP